MDISIGCHFVFDVPTATHAVVLVEPHVDEEARVVAPRFEVEPAVPLSGYLDRFENHISSRAPFGLVLLFQLAMPSEVPGYVLGVARYRFVKYLVILGLVELPFAVGTVHLGASFIEQRSWVLIAIGGAGIGLTTWAIYTLQKRISG